MWRGTPFTAFTSGATCAIGRGGAGSGRAAACITFGSGRAGGCIAFGGSFGSGGFGSARCGSFGGGGFGAGGCGRDVSVRTTSGRGIRITRMRCSFFGSTGFGAGAGSFGARWEIQGTLASRAAAHKPAACIDTDRNRRGGSATRSRGIGAHSHDQLG